MYRAAHGGDGSVSLSGGDGGDGGVFLSIHSFSQSYNSKANEKSRLSAGCPVSRATVCFLHSHRRPRHRRIYVRSPRFGWGVGKLHFCFLFVYLYCYMCTVYCMRAAHTQSSLRSCGWRIAILAEENDATAGLRYVLCIERTHQIE